MRIRKKHHPIAHGLAFLFTAGASAPVSAAMIGAKAARNKKADKEVEMLAEAMRGQACPGCGLASPGAARFCASCGTSLPRRR